MKTGSVEVGNKANLLLLNANSLDDLGNLQKQEGVILKGKWYAIADLREEMEEAAVSW